MSDVDTALERVVSLAEFEPLARAAMDPAAFDYVAGGSWSEISLADNEAAWSRYRFRPRVMVDVAEVHPATTLLGAPTAMPVAIAPMAVHSIAHPEGELATIRAAGAAGIPYTHSTTSSRSIEEVAAAAPDATRWFQLYVQRDAGATESLVRRAAAAGFGAIVLTADLPGLGHRPRNVRSGFQLPPLANFADAAATHGSHGLAVADELGGRISQGLVWSDIATIRSWSPLPLVLKGILTAEDARLAVEHGVDGIVVSNHGGRQLDRVPAAIDVLAEVAAAVDGRAEIWVDGGVRSGLDVAIALALGARGVLVGRPIFWALAAGGQPGVERALAILREEFIVALRLLGTPSPFDIRPGHLAG
ncbi:MAG: alpha-hydroxy-acid oxidizing protein [Chloroflexi bacterium]|nr:alpha-hydroxy-acid oxidizing protein [Chloroflexota bacterium]